MEWWLLIVTYGLLGAGIKYIDQAYDIGVFNKRIALLMAVLMGILMGTAASLDPMSAMFFLSFVIFALITKKIDNPAFYVGTFLVFLIPLLRAILHSADYQTNWLILTVLIFSGWMDEKGNELADQRRLRGLLYFFFEYRSVMKIVVFLLAIYSIIPLAYFFAFMTYDLSYLAVAIYSKRLLIRYNIQKSR